MREDPSARESNIVRVQLDSQGCRRIALENFGARLGYPGRAHAPNFLFIFDCSACAFSSLSFSTFIFMYLRLSSRHFFDSRNQILSTPPWRETGNTDRTILFTIVWPSGIIWFRLSINVATHSVYSLVFRATSLGFFNVHVSNLLRLPSSRSRRSFLLSRLTVFSHDFSFRFPLRETSRVSSKASTRIIQWQLTALRFCFSFVTSFCA